MVGDGVPPKVHAPVKATSDQRRGLVLKGVVVNDVDDGDDHVVLVLFDAAQQRLHPVHVHLTVTVQED